MSSLDESQINRYSDKELHRLYPDRLRLIFLQVIFRHGERTPVRARLQSAGIPRYFDSCPHVKHFDAAVKSAGSSGWSRLAYVRAIEEEGLDGKAISPMIPSDKCLLGELTMKGRETTLELGRRLRELYCERLGFMPAIERVDQLYLRSSLMPRALESLQQVLLGMYPKEYLPAGKDIKIYQRNFTEENLFPNESACKKLRQLSEQYAEKAAINWNPVLEGRTSDMFAKFVETPIRVDGTPRLSGLMDTINSARANGLELPRELLDKEMLDTMHKAVVEEWFGGYLADHTYRRLGAGRLLGDLRDRIVESTHTMSPLKVALYGAHDTTLGSTLACIATKAHELHWPPFTSHMAIEVFEETLPKFFGLLSTKSFFVRVRYNDAIVPIQGCQVAELCTLAEFNKIVDAVVPTDWQAECQV